MKSKIFNNKTKHKHELLYKIWSDFSENKIAVVALCIFLVILFVAVFASLISPTDPYDLSTVTIMNARLAPMEEDFSGTIYWLGTDGAGRDMLSAIFYGL